MMESICWVGLGTIKEEKNGLGLHVSLALLSENTALINKPFSVSPTDDLAKFASKGITLSYVSLREYTF